MNRTSQAFEVFGVLDFAVYFVLRYLGLNPEPLRLDGPTHPDRIAERNARRFAGHFGTRKIQAIKELRNATGMSLKDSRDAVEQIYATYGLDKEALRREILTALESGQDEVAVRLMDHFRNL